MMAGRILRRNDLKRNWIAPALARMMSDPSATARRSFPSTAFGNRADQRVAVYVSRETDNLPATARN